MANDKLLTRGGVARRWDVSPRTIDRLRQAGKLAWVDIAGGRSSRPTVRFKLQDIEMFEAAMRHERVA